jgi:hypothetical protein
LTSRAIVDSRSEKEKNFGHPSQFAFSVHGKHVGTCGFGSVRPVVGTIITTLPVGQPFQARLGLESFSTTGVPNFCRDVEISCKAGEKEGFPPRVWDCFGQNKFDVEFEFQLIKVNEREDVLCSLFEDGQDVRELQKGEEGRATGLVGGPAANR